MDSPPFRLSDPTGCLCLLLWSVLESQRDRPTLLIYTNHSKNNEKDVEKYQGGGNGKAQLSFLLFQPHEHSENLLFNETWWHNFVSTLKDVKISHSVYWWHLTQESLSCSCSFGKEVMNYYCDYGYYLSDCLFQELEIDVQLNITAKVDFMY